MKRDELLARFRAIVAEQAKGSPSARDDDGDPETDHIEADELLLAYINDEEITEAFKSIYRWYA